MLSTDSVSRNKGCEKGGRGGVVLTSPEGLKLYHAFIYSFNLTNNEIDYKAFLRGLKVAMKLEVERVKVKMDSRLVVWHVTRTFEARDKKMIKYKEMVFELLAAFMTFEITQVTREENLDAERLSKISRSTLSYVS